MSSAGRKSSWFVSLVSPAGGNGGAAGGDFLVAGFAGCNFLLLTLAIAVDAAAAVAIVAEAAETTTAVKLDAVAAASDAVLVASAGAGRRRGEGGEGVAAGAAGGAAGAAGSHAGGWADVAEFAEGGSLELVADVLHADWRGAVVGLADFAGLVGLGWLGSHDPGRRERTAFGDIDRLAMVFGGSGRRGRSARNIEDVQGTLGAGFNSGFLGGVIGDLDVVDDVLCTKSVNINTSPKRT